MKAADGCKTNCIFGIAFGILWGIVIAIFVVEYILWRIFGDPNVSERGKVKRNRNKAAENAPENEEEEVIVTEVHMDARDKPTDAKKEKSKKDKSDKKKDKSDKKEKSETKEKSEKKEKSDKKEKKDKKKHHKHASSEEMISVETADETGNRQHATNRSKNADLNAANQNEPIAN